MKIHHYTTIETLALILKNKTIRFNRLDKVDDLEEAIYGISTLNLKLGKYFFVSCWTKEDAENVALWGLYTQNKGIRITLDEDMFITYPVNEKNKSFFPNFIEFGSDYIITCANNNSKLIDIDYVDDLNLKIKNLGVYAENPSDHKFELSFSNEFGNFKSKHWEFQKECRFKIFALPYKIPKNDVLLNSKNRFNILNSAMNSISYSLMENQNISKEYFDIPLNDFAFQNMEILLAPQTTMADKLIVEALIKSFCPTALLKESNLTGKIRSKF